MNRRLTSADYHPLNVTRFIQSYNRQCVAIAEVNATQTVASGVVTILDYANVIYDRYSGITTGAAWKFTCPDGKAGFYDIHGAVRYNAAAWAVNDPNTLDLYLDGAQLRRIDSFWMQAAGTYITALRGGTLFYLAEDSYFDLRAYHTQGGTLTVPNTPEGVYITIARIS